jgi:hypothetical protein
MNSPRNSTGRQEHANGPSTPVLTTGSAPVQLQTEIHSAKLRVCCYLGPGLCQGQTAAQHTPRQPTKKFTDNDNVNNYVQIIIIISHKRTKSLHKSRTRQMTRLTRILTRQRTTTGRSLPNQPTAKLLARKCLRLPSQPGVGCMPGRAAADSRTKLPTRCPWNGSSTLPEPRCPAAKCCSTPPAASVQALRAGMPPPCLCRQLRGQLQCSRNRVRMS